MLDEERGVGVPTEIYKKGVRGKRTNEVKVLIDRRTTCSPINK